MPQDILLERRDSEDAHTLLLAGELRLQGCHLSFSQSHAAHGLAVRDGDRLRCCRPDLGLGRGGDNAAVVARAWERCICARTRPPICHGAGRGQRRRIPHEERRVANGTCHRRVATSLRAGGDGGGGRHKGPDEPSPHSRCWVRGPVARRSTARRQLSPLDEDDVAQGSVPRHLRVHVLCKRSRPLARCLGLNCRLRESLRECDGARATLDEVVGRMAHRILPCQGLLPVCLDDERPPMRQGTRAGMDHAELPEQRDELVCSGVTLGKGLGCHRAVHARGEHLGLELLHLAREAACARSPAHIHLQGLRVSAFSRTRREHGAGGREDH
mmetsp:Transcript_14270/g.43346  ORF Transcript_14270/g.43346 Transcript_14270/m.43346 type:complete len:328 (-) Transcript_14270:821-1804(-)